MTDCAHELGKGSTMELMAPAGGWDALEAALRNGADSVYFGVDQLNMRARATMNFTLADLPAITARCAENSAKTYLTLNTVVYDHDLSVVRRVVDAAASAGISAVIAADHAVIMACQNAEMPVHISTQANISNVETVRFYATFADVMVLARELSLRQVKAICQEVAKARIMGPGGLPVRIEVFGHGALCMAVSGKCHLSLHTHNASANRGACVQNCRRAYKVTDLEEGHEFVIDNEHIMSPKDLCTVDFLDRLSDTGASVLKIEGRGRAADYVATVTACYREAIDSLADGSYGPDRVAAWMQRLATVYNRGFWGGYYLGQQMGEWTDSPGSKATQRKLHIGRIEHYYPKVGVAHAVLKAHGLSAGDRVLITGPFTGAMEHIISELRVDDQPVQAADKGQEVTFPFPAAVRPSDKLYRLVAA